MLAPEIKLLLNGLKVFELSKQEAKMILDIIPKDKSVLMELMGYMAENKPNKDEIIEKSIQLSVDLYE